MSSYTKQRVSTFLALGALTSTSVTKGELTAAMVNEARVTSIVGSWGIRDQTAGEGPIVFGVAHPDYSATEISEWLSVSQAGPGKLIEREKGNRLIREIGQFSGRSTEEVLNDGRPVKTKLNWLIDDTDTALSVWAYNLSGGTLTTGSAVTCNGHINMFWV